MSLVVIPDQSLVAQEPSFEPMGYNALIPSAHEMAVFATMAKQAVTSKMYRGIGDEAGVMMIMLSAREMGIPPMAALNGGVNIISGKVEIAARMMTAMIRRAGHSLQIVENTDSICTLKGRRCDNGDSATVSYTIQDAQKAGLVKSGGGWTKNPKDMVFARAASRLARQLFSDVIGIGYVEGEIKGAACEVIENDSLPRHEIKTINAEVIPLFDLEQMEKELRAMVKEEDNSLVMDYLQVVQDHFNWSREHTIQEFLNDKEHTLQKFEIWKGKK
jgi:hypothetical protein